MGHSVGRHRTNRLLAVATTAAFVVAACSSSKSSSTGTTASGSSAKGKERELVIARDMDINSLDVSRSYCDTCQIVNTAIYETLLTVDVADATKLLPRLATSYTANADNTVFTFKLDPAAKFADGSQVEPKDVKWSWERLANIKGSGSYLMAGLKSIDTPDATTVVATFASSNSAFLPIAAASYLGIINSDVATAQGASAGADAETADKAEPWFLAHSAGSGPYALASYTQGDSLVMVRNDKYWGKRKPAFPKVTIKQVKDSASQLQQLQQGDADIAMQISFDSMAQIQGGKAKAEAVDSFNYVYIALSPGAVGAEPLKDANVRKAIKLAIDYDGAITALVAGQGKKQASPIPNGFQGAKDLALPKTDLAEAQKLLDAAGKSAGFELDATYPKVNVYGVDFDLMMQKLKQDLAKVKIDLKLTPVEFPQWSEKIGAQGIPVTAVYFAPDHSDSSQYVQYFGMIPDSSWAARAGGGKAGKPIDNAKESTLLTAALAAAGDAKTKAYTELGQAMVDDLVILPIVNPKLVLAYAADVTGMHYSACCNLDLALVGLKG